MRSLATPPMKFALLVALVVALQLAQESEAVRESFKIKPRQMDSLPVALNLLRRFMPGKLTLIQKCERYAILLQYQKSLTQFSVAELGISPERANLRLSVDSETLRDLYVGAINELKTGHLDQSLLDLVECVRTRYGAIDGKARAFLNQNDIKSLTEQYKSTVGAPMEILINDQVTHPKLKANDLHPALKQTLSDLYHGDESKLEKHFPNLPEPEEPESTPTEAPKPAPATPKPAPATPKPVPATPKPEAKKQAVVVVETKGSNAQASAQASSVDDSASTAQAVAQANSANDAASATSSAGSNQPAAAAASAHGIAGAASNGQAQAGAAADASDASSNEVSDENSDEASDADSGEVSDANSGEKNADEEVEPAQEESEEELSHEELEFLNDVKSNLAAVFDGLPENAELPDRCLAYSKITNSDEADLKIPNRADQIVKEITASMAARPQTPAVGEEEQQFVPEKPIRDSFMVVLDVFKPEDLGEQLYVDVLDCVAVWQEVDPDIKVYMENHIG